MWLLGLRPWTLTHGLQADRPTPPRTGREMFHFKNWLKVLERLRDRQNGKRCSKGTELLKEAEAALSCVTHGKFDKCNIQNQWENWSCSLPNCSLPSLPTPPLQHTPPPRHSPALGGSTWDHLRGGDSVLNVYPKLETSRTTAPPWASWWTRPASVCLEAPGLALHLPPGPLYLATSATPWHSHGMVGGEGGG